MVTSPAGGVVDDILDDLERVAEAAGVSHDPVRLGIAADVRAVVGKWRETCGDVEKLAVLGSGSASGIRGYFLSSTLARSAERSIDDVAADSPPRAGCCGGACDPEVPASSGASDGPAAVPVTDESSDEGAALEDDLEDDLEELYPDRVVVTLRRQDGAKLTEDAARVPLTDVKASLAAYVSVEFASTTVSDDCVTAVFAIEDPSTVTLASAAASGVVCAPDGALIDVRATLAYSEADGTIVEIPDDGDFDGGSDAADGTEAEDAPVGWGSTWGTLIVSVAAEDASGLEADGALDAVANLAVQTLRQLGDLTIRFQGTHDPGNLATIVFGVENGTPMFEELCELEADGLPEWEGPRMTPLRWGGTLTIPGVGRVTASASAYDEL